MEYDMPFFQLLPNNKINKNTWRHDVMGQQSTLDGNVTSLTASNTPSCHWCHFSMCFVSISLCSYIFYILYSTQYRCNIKGCFTLLDIQYLLISTKNIVFQEAACCSQTTYVKKHLICHTHTVHTILTLRRYFILDQGHSGIRACGWVPTCYWAPCTNTFTYSLIGEIYLSQSTYWHVFGRWEKIERKPMLTWEEHVQKMCTDSRTGAVAK